MATINVSAQRTIDAPAGEVYTYLADVREHRPHFLPPAFEDFKVEDGSEETVVSYKVNAGRRVRAYRVRVEQSEPGRMLTDRDLGSSLVTRYTVESSGEASQVRIETSWEGAGGVGGFFERTFAPRVLGQLYEEELNRLNEYAHARKGSASF
jgi:uncharacterized membrane protein